MKALIKYKDIYGNRKQKTIEVDKNEVNYIIGEFVWQCNLPSWVYVYTIKCQHTEYQWYGPVKDGALRYYKY